ncbi:MAG: TetR/AcrR family transcriptional regulator [Bacteroidales bacterium]
MENTGNSTEEKIFNAALQEFVEKGYDGARMQSIADRAGINKALLHYYYRTKDKLFEAVVPQIIKQLPIGINSALEKEGSIEDKITAIVHLYITFLKNNPGLFNFVLRELLSNPERLARIFKQILESESNNLIGLLAELIQQEAKAGNIVPIRPEQLITNLISLCVFPFIGKFMVEHIILKNIGTSYDDFIKNRENEVVTFILKAIKP